MKKGYTLILLNFICFTQVFAAPRFWVGGVSGNWNTTASWSASSGGPSGASIPVAGDDVTFNTSATVNINTASITVNSLLITASATVKFITTANTSFTVNSSASLTPGLKIDAGSLLGDSTGADVDFNFIFNTATSAIGTIDGTWTFGGLLPLASATTGCGMEAQSGTTVNVNGAITFYSNAGIANVLSGATMSFNAASFLNFAGNGGLIPSRATFNTTSTINVTGSTDALPSFFASPPSYGNVIINVPNLSFANTIFTSNGTVVKGDLQFLNTNGFPVSIIGNTGISPFNVTINKNLVISGANTAVSLATDDGLGSGNLYTLSVGQNLSFSSGTFSLQDDNAAAGSSTLQIAGNFSQTGGVFTTNSTATNTSANLFVVEMNGAAAQTFSSSTGTINNAQNMVALRLNNTSGGVTLNSPLTVGRVDFVSGTLTTTGTNLLTINDPANSGIVVNNPSATSYINGPVKRHMNTATAYLLPTGKSTKYHYCEIAPSSTSDTYYTGEYFNTGFGTYMTVAPLAGVSQAEYWNINKNTGADASVRLSLIGTAIFGVPAADSITVARYNGATWGSERGGGPGLIALTPGNTTTGNTISQVQSTYGNFTFGFGPNVALPIKLLSFGVQKVAGNAKLDWEVDITSTAASFEVLKSLDGSTFNKTGVVNAFGGVVKYTYTDHLQSGTNYYRLKMIDKDGSFTLSKVVAIINKDNGIEITSMAPTLVHDRAKLEIASAKGGRLELQVTDMLGRTWRKLGVTIAQGNSDVWLDFSDLGAGVYQVTGYMDDNKTSSIRFVKQ